MLSPDIEARYLRPLALKDTKLDSSWSDNRNYWIARKDGGFIKGKLIEKNDEIAVIELPDNTREEVDSNNLLSCNASRFDCCEDVAEMAELNEATVLDNLKQRYDSNLIYTYSGLFLVAVNPYRHIPIYSTEVVDHYKKQRRTERPPHVFAVADTAYRSLIETRQNQSILITGESGAGKTENTKRVIQYLATIASATTTNGTLGLEQQIIQANPILEAFGNAQTVRNDNSSRFGKFIRIEFNNSGAICGGNIEKYLLEKSRITHRSAKERSFHIFYQFLHGAPQELKESLGIDGGVLDYNYTKGSNFSVDEIDDKADFEQLVRSMEVLGFTDDERTAYFRIIAAILLLGNLCFEDDENGQAKLVNRNVAETVSACLGISCDDFITGLLNPVFKAGRDELVTQARDAAQVIYSIEALSRSLYDRMFTKLVERINKTIDKAASAAGKSNFIGVLDIAGFEIFERNSFEQLCINHTNERLQQFFNHHMFIIEQEEYRRESIVWEYVDFGLDLQPTIDLLEKSNPIGILALLDEDCVMPKATDRSFCEKVSTLWKGKSNKFETTRFGDGFLISHYAGKVEYRTDGWLVKNKDPLNDNVTRLLAHSSHNFVRNLFVDFVGSDEEVYQATKGTKRGLFRTVAQKHRESLALLMQQLYATQPHFIRCIIPNEGKHPGLIDSKLVLDQLRCNGVLEGIRICRIGYPNRLLFADFCRLYEVLLSTSTPLAADNKIACNQLLEQLGMCQDKDYRLGQSKVFFKTGIIGKLDEARDQKLSALLCKFQATYRFILAKRARTRQSRQQDAVQFLQRNVRVYLQLRQWPWWRLFTQMKPLLNVTRTENRIGELEKELGRMSLEREQQLDQLRGDLDSERNMLFSAETKRRELERENQQLQLQLVELNESKAALMERKMGQELEIVRLKEKITTELELQQELMQKKINNMEKEQNDLKTTIEEQKNSMASLKMKIDQVEFERLKLERSEAALRTRLSESEMAIEEARRAKKDFETKLKFVEEERLKVQEQLEDEIASQERRKHLDLEHEQQVRQIKQQYEDEIKEREDEWETTRKRFQRELHQHAFDLEQEQRTTTSLKETVKKYESGADNLATQLEAEMRNQTNWKREKERLEQRLKETGRLQQEAIEREDALAAQVSLLHEQLREYRAKMMDTDELASNAERQRKTIEGRYEALVESHRELVIAKQAVEKSLCSLELQVTGLSGKLYDEQDSVLLLKEQLTTSEQLTKLAQAEIETERKQNEKLTQEKVILDAQIKELQFKLLEQESNGGGGTNSRASLRKTSMGASLSTAYQQILSTIEADGAERQSLVKETRRQERVIRDLHSQLAERDRLRIGMEESLDKGELRVRKLQTALETLENRNSELEVVKRRAERDLIEEKEKGERLARECERFRAKASLCTSVEQL